MERLKPCPFCSGKVSLVLCDIELQPIDTKEVTYCLHCGQAIDWED